MVGNSFHMQEIKHFFQYFFYVNLKLFEVDKEENSHLFKLEEKGLS
jgi:hypothetical protein